MAITEIRVEWVSLPYGRRDHLNARTVYPAYEDSMVNGTLGVASVDLPDAGIIDWGQPDDDHDINEVIFYTDGKVYRATVEPGDGIAPGSPNDPAADPVVYPWTEVSTKFVCPDGASGAIIRVELDLNDTLDVGVNKDPNTGSTDKEEARGIVYDGGGVRIRGTAPNDHQVLHVMVPTIPEHPYPTEDAPDSGFVQFRVTNIA